jgi:hypothetical protein
VKKEIQVLLDQWAIQVQLVHPVLLALKDQKVLKVKREPRVQ